MLGGNAVKGDNDVKKDVEKNKAIIIIDDEDEDKNIKNSQHVFSESSAIPVSPDKVSILSWNIDGLDEREQEVRAIAVCDVINSSLPEIVMLQEVVDEYLNILQTLCTSYIFKLHNVAQYYNILMFKKHPNLTLMKNLKWINFPNTNMGRNLLRQEVEVHGRHYTVMTTHLESTKECKLERQEQLGICLDAVYECPQSHNVILAGDMNIREAELKEMGGVGHELCDAWEACGSNYNTKFTWNLQLNDNLTFNWGKPKARYDRMFFRTTKVKPDKCDTFQLVGTERIEACKLFPSDHFGMLVTFRPSC